MDRPQDPVAVPSVSVVIPCRNEAATIGDLLEAIAGQDVVPHEIIAVDDGSFDATAAVIAECGRQYPGLNIAVVRGSGRGAAAAMNTGIRRASGDIIVRFDGHCRPRPDYLRRCVQTLLDRDAGVVGGVWQIEPGAATTVAKAIAAVVAHPVGSGGVAYRDSTLAAGIIRDVDTVPFGCFRRAVWEEVGGYDERLIANEDYDFNYRVRRAARSILLDTDIRSFYGSRSTLRALGRQYFRYGFWKTQMLRKSPEALRLRQVPPALVLPWIGATGLMALSMAELATSLVAAAYPGLIAAAGIHIAASKGDARLLLPALAAIIVQHAAWSAGFWHGLVWPPRPV